MRYHTIRRDRKTAPAATICITRPVLPVILDEFGITAAGILEARADRGVMEIRICHSHPVIPHGHPWGIPSGNAPASA